MPADSIEMLFRTGDFRVLQWTDARFEGDRTQRVVLQFEDGIHAVAKWAVAPPRGVGVFNNRPRYEIAAYELQKLFLDEPEYVVPPTVARCVSLESYRAMDPWAEATFENTESVLIVLQYWLWNVKADGVWNKDRFERDTLYARHFANMNLLTYLILHGDSNKGNVLISTTSNPRLFAVDNGIAFTYYQTGDRGTKWRNLRVKRLPGKTVARLRALTREELDRHLLVVAQFRRADSRLIAVTPTEPIHPDEGVSRNDEVVQLGLTKAEIGHILGRIQKVLKKVDEEKIALF